MIVEGADAVHKTGTVAYRGVTVEVREGSKSAANALVTFVLPETAPTGVFPSGQRTETTRTDAQGKASVWGIRWGAFAGPVAMTITARSGESSAGTMATLRLDGPRMAPSPSTAVASFEVNAPPPSTPVPAPAPARAGSVNPDGIAPPPARRPAVVLTTSNERVETMSGSKSKWVLIGLGVAGAVGGGFAYKMMRNQTTAAVPTAPPTPVLVLSAPTISVGKP
ncbi:MAG: hypothetical protein HY820_40590 [Acidobacteria bacterium]|nr:hypothetical protein [Acidobacteriota bacterium]